MNNVDDPYSLFNNSRQDNCPKCFRPYENCKCDQDVTYKSSLKYFLDNNSITDKNCKWFMSKWMKKYISYFTNTGCLCEDEDKIIKHVEQLINDNTNDPLLFMNEVKMISISCVISQIELLEKLYKAKHIQ